jgi:hypothetical protein
MLFLLKSDISLNFNKVLFKAMSFKCHAHFLHSGTKKAGVPKVLGLGEYFFLRCGEKRWSVMFCTLPFVSIVVPSSGALPVGSVCVLRVFSFYLKMTRTKKFASKPKFRGHKCVRVNKDTGVSEKREPLSDQNNESSCVKPNLTASNKRIRGTSVNTKIKVGESNS